MKARQRQGGCSACKSPGQAFEDRNPAYAVGVPVFRTLAVPEIIVETDRFVLPRQSAGLAVYGTSESISRMATRRKILK